MEASSIAVHAAKLVAANKADDVIKVMPAIYVSPIFALLRFCLSQRVLKQICFFSYNFFLLYSIKMAKYEDVKETVWRNLRRVSSVIIDRYSPHEPTLRFCFKFFMDAILKFT